MVRDARATDKARLTLVFRAPSVACRQKPPVVQGNTYTQQGQVPDSCPGRASSAWLRNEGLLSSRDLGYPSHPRKLSSTQERTIQRHTRHVWGVWTLTRHVCVPMDNRRSPRPFSNPLSLSPSSGAFFALALHRVCFAAVQERVGATQPR